VPRQNFFWKSETIDCIGVVELNRCWFLVVQKRENPVISDWVHVSGGHTEGSLGRVAGAAAGGAQREVGGGGTVNARSHLPCVPLSFSAHTVPEFELRGLALTFVSRSRSVRFC
jgi:hypothetical protein